MEKKIKEIKGFLKSEFRKIFEDEKGLIISFAPGRINLIGEHTDYNDGFVLPATIDRAVYIGLRRRKDKNCVFYSINFKELSSWSVEKIEKKEGHHWSNYIRGVIKLLIDKGFEIGGVEGIVYGDVPIGSGLSSSAAIEVATGIGLQNLFELEIEPLELILLCKRAENEFVGVQCGIMDQFVSRLGKKDHALFLDCRTLKYKNVTFKMDEYKVLIVNTKIKRELASSAYNERRKECETAVEFFKKMDNSVRALRDVSLEMLKSGKNKLPENLFRRALHVISENKRVMKAIEFLRDSKIREFGSLLYESHKSLRDNYEVSCEELDFIVRFSINSGAEGARLTGAGFGGSAIVLLNKENLESFVEALKKSYNEKFSYSPEIIELQSNLEAGIIK